MESLLEPHPWVTEGRDRVRFGLQAFCSPTEPRPERRILEAGQAAELLGFDAFFLGDHPAGAPECWLHLAALAVVTERVRLGPLVSCVGYRPPLLTARLAADLDRLSDGRLVLGLGIGWDARDLGSATSEFDRMGLPYPRTAERQAALEEAIAIIEGAWSGPFSLAGRHYAAVDAQVTPPVQAPRPPLVIAGAGERRTLRQVAELADACNFGSLVTGGVDGPEQAQQKLDVLRGHCEAIGRPYENLLRSHFTHWLILAPDDAALRRKLDGYFPDGLDDVTRRSVVAGTPEVVAAHFQALADVGLECFVAQLDATDRETIELLASEVAPSVERAREVVHV